MSNIYDTANELSRGLRDLPEYKAVVASKAQIDADPQATQLFKDYVAFQQELQLIVESGQMPTDEMQKRIETFGKQIEENSIVLDFFNKQQQLSIYLTDIEKIIFEPIQDLLK